MATQANVFADSLGSAKGAHVELTGVSKSYGESKAVASLTFTVGRGEFYSLLGPSGCGKTTTLRLIAGLEKPDTGAISIGGTPVAAHDAWVKPENRGIGIVFQDYALFPHMTVSQNVLFGLKGWQRQKANERVGDMLDLTGLPDMGGRYPHELSGGQRQRVALARSLAPSPQVILLDEPFSNLDADLREELRMETKRILKTQGATTILVTHDQEEAFALSDRVGVLREGFMDQEGAPVDLYHNPRSRFVANFVGKANIVAGKVEGERVITEFGIFPLDDGIASTDGRVEIMIRPENVSVSLDPAGDVTIAEAIFLGASTHYLLRLDSGSEIRAARPSAEVYPVGLRARLELDGKCVREWAVAPA